MKKLTNPKLILITGTIAVLAIATFLFFTKNRQPLSPKTTPTTAQTDSNLNLAPATEEEKQATQQHKDDLAKQAPSNTSTAPSGQKKQVSVVITSTSPNSLNAYVSGVLEDGGICTLVLTKGSQTITKTSAGFGNVNTTNCTPFSFETLSSGTWNAVVSYSSPSAEGKSQTTIEAP